MPLNLLVHRQPTHVATDIGPSQRKQLAAPEPVPIATATIVVEAIGWYVALRPVASMVRTSRTLNTALP